MSQPSKKHYMQRGEDEGGHLLLTSPAPPTPPPAEKECAPIYRVPYNLKDYEKLYEADYAPPSPSTKTKAQFFSHKRSSIADKILNAASPIEVDKEAESITVNDLSGIHVNKSDEQNWTSTVPIENYSINVDPNPEVVHKTNEAVVEYKQPINIQYLRPPTPPVQGEIVIKQERDVAVPAAPPVIIRQRPASQNDVYPIILREKPPSPPPILEKQVINVPGKLMSPPPRQLIVEKLPPLPKKPQPIIIEKWLPYETQKRAVKFVREENVVGEPVAQKNKVILWDSPKVAIEKEIKTLSTKKVDPNAYRQLYGNSLMTSEQIEHFLREQNIDPALVSVSKPSRSIELEGDLDALSFIDLDKAGLSEFTVNNN